VSFDKVFSVPSAPIELKPSIVEKEISCKNGGIEEKSKIIEEIISEKNDEEKEVVEIKTKSDEFDGKVNKIAIADRKKLYERSTSLIEENPKTKLSILERTESLRDDSKIRNGSKTNMNNKRTSTVFGKVSKFRHLKGTTSHKSQHIENIKNISRQISGECDGFHANFERVAVPLSGSGGKIAVFELSKPGKLPDGVIPTLVNGSNIMDFQWNPFNAKELIVACDDGSVKIWEIPEGGLKESTNTPDREFNAHNEKIQFMKFHPLARDVLLTASYDMTMKLWNLKTLELQITLKGHSEQIFGFSWSSCGKFGATVSRDQKIRIYEPRKSEMPIKEGVGGPVGTRGARIMFALDDEFIVVTGFDKASERQIYIFKTNNLNTAIGMVGLDVSPAILVPFYDEDSSTIFVTGRGDTTIYAYGKFSICCYE
jgi:coronin-7